MDLGQRDPVRCMDLDIRADAPLLRSLTSQRVATECSMQRETSGSLGIDCMDRSEFNGLEKRGTEVTENSKAPCTGYPNELDGLEFADTHNAGPESSPGQGGDCEIVSMYESASYDSFACNGNDRQFQDNIWQTQENLPFSAPGCAVEGEENNCMEQISEVKCRGHASLILSYLHPL